MSLLISITSFYVYFHNIPYHEQLWQGSWYTMIYFYELSHFFGCYACLSMHDLLFFSLISLITPNNSFPISWSPFMIVSGDSSIYIGDFIFPFVS